MLVERELNSLAMWWSSATLPRRRQRSSAERARVRPIRLRQRIPSKTLAVALYTGMVSPGAASNRSAPRVSDRPAGRDATAALRPSRSNGQLGRSRVAFVASALPLLYQLLRVVCGGAGEGRESGCPVVSRQEGEAGVPGGKPGDRGEFDDRGAEDGHGLGGSDVGCGEHDAGRVREASEESACQVIRRVFDQRAQCAATAFDVPSAGRCGDRGQTVGAARSTTREGESHKAELVAAARCDGDTALPCGACVHGDEYVRSALPSRVMGVSVRGAPGAQENDGAIQAQRPSARTCRSVRGACPVTSRTAVVVWAPCPVWTTEKSSRSRPTVSSGRPASRHARA